MWSYPYQYDLAINMITTSYQITSQGLQEEYQPSPLDSRRRTFLSTDEKIVTSETHSTNPHFAI